jgi:hypothetical protein
LEAAAVVVAEAMEFAVFVDLGAVWFQFEDLSLVYLTALELNFDAYYYY